MYLLKTTRFALATAKAVCLGKAKILFKVQYTILKFKNTKYFSLLASLF